MSRWIGAYKCEANGYESAKLPGFLMLDKGNSLEWLHQRTEEYRSGKNDVHDLVEDLEHEGKLGQGFSLMDCLEEMDIGD
jgi:hypothetical protein